MATNFSNPDSLDTLTGAVNQALIETGRFFRSSGSVQSQAQLKRGIPAAHEQFQSALDSLSEQIFLAKAFLERDYEAIRATQGKEDQGAATQDVTMKEETDTNHETTEPTAAAAAAAAAAAPETAAAEPVPAVATESGPAAAEQTAQEDATGKIKTEPQPTTTEEPPAAGAGQPSQPSEPAEKPIKTENPEETGPGVDTGAGTGADITEGKAEPGTNDSNGGGGGGGVNEFDLHLDFGDDEIGNRNFLSGAFGTTGTGDGTTPDLDHSAATGGGDAFDMELQKVGGAADTEQQQQQQQQSQPQPQPQDTTGSAQMDGGGSGGEMLEDVMGPGESSFDDLFLDSENFGGDGDQGLLDGDGLMNMSELDDNWFT